MTTSVVSGGSRPWDIQQRQETKIRPKQVSATLPVNITLGGRDLEERNEEAADYDDDDDLDFRKHDSLIDASKAPASDDEDILGDVSTDACMFGFDVDEEPETQKLEVDDREDASNTPRERGQRARSSQFVPPHVLAAQRETRSFCHRPETRREKGFSFM
eukprot:CAMPEP_0198727928 /NCGR_PEP_ID=MMETSP1475-20131203/6323_1 /TAXON_ID= ORGANISM="Unidentified sp., Strain CCMP1999" /NCGR_SAMPLE_ID=MMETSP1475 /ASSEMBLY_ACC=CAM_ASM_001111 /LENGTH=159 /DNA_ID=CAMNT_0044490143 /DNA_START=150 /DNA_END=629 /DNA_ORIENTATION=+